MKKKFLIIMCKNKLILRKPESNLFELPFYIENQIPNTPYYHYFFESNNDYGKIIINAIGKLRFDKLSILIPDDTLETDRRIIQEFFMLHCATRTPTIIPQCSLLSNTDKNYISISRSCRCISIWYIKNNIAIASRFLDKDIKDISFIKENIRVLHADCEYGNLPIYINNIEADMSYFDGLGQLVSFDELLKVYHESL